MFRGWHPCGEYGSAKATDRQQWLLVDRQAIFGASIGETHRFGGGEAQEKYDRLPLMQWSVIHLKKNPDKYSLHNTYCFIHNLFNHVNVFFVIGRDH